MNTLELFSGTKSFSNYIHKYGFNTLTIDNDKNLNPDICIDILNIDLLDHEQYDIIWASPPCTTFSVASIGKHWTGGKEAYIPKTENAKIGLLLLDKTINIISINKPKYWFIENPRGVMRKVINKIFAKYNITDYHRVTIWYCQYGDKRAKPTDIWTNLNGWYGKQCKNNHPTCHHEKAPRGSKTGTQGLKNATERGRIPEQLFKEIEEYWKQ